MISPLPGATVLKPGSATFPLPGLEADIVDGAGRRSASGRLSRVNDRGRRCCGASGDPESYRNTYWSRFEGVLRRRRRQARHRRLLLAAGPRRRHHARVGAQHQHDGSRVRARRSPSGRGGRGCRQGRRDHRAGHRRVRHPAQWRRSERRARRGAPRPRGQAHPARSPSRSGALHRGCRRPARAEIMRRLLRGVAEDQALGDTTTLADPTVVDGSPATWRPPRSRE